MDANFLVFQWMLIFWFSIGCKADYKMASVQKPRQLVEPDLLKIRPSSRVAANARY